MKVLVIPDIHLKPDIITKADTLMQSGNYNQAVFLGDLVDDWGQGTNIGLYDRTFDALDQFLRKYPETIYCWGNHDVSYLWQRSESGYSTVAEVTVIARWQEIKARIPNTFKFAHRIDNIVFSHAGFTKDFVDAHFMGHSMDHIIGLTNRMSPRYLWADDSPIWARPYPGIDYFSENLLQIVGHTPVRTSRPLKAQHIVICDNFSTEPNGRPIGNQTFLCVDTETKDWSEVKCM